MSDFRAEYMRQYRKTANGQASVEAQKMRQKAQLRAYRHLANLYQGEYLIIFNQELKRLRIEAAEDKAADAPDTPSTPESD